MTDHIWTQENLDAYLANGLNADERSDLERHVADCAECTQSLQAARKLETTMKTLFADAPPPAGLAERALVRLRREPIAYPRWVRYAMGAAAVLVLGLVGAVVQAVVADGGAEESHEKFDSGPRQARNVKGNVSPVSLERRAQRAVGPAANNDGDASSANANGILGIDRERTGLAGLTVLDDSESMIAQTTPSPAVLPRGVTKIRGANKIQEAGRDQQQAEADLLYLAKPESASLYGGSGATHNYSLRVDGRGGEADEKSVAAGLSKEALENRKTGLDLETFKRVPSNSAASAEYFKPLGDIIKPAPGTPPAPVAKPPASVSSPEAYLPTELSMPKEQPKAGQPPKDGPPQQPEPTAGRKIIRTGDMEFEVESFDTAKEGIGKLLGAVKGGFIATVNSDKLPNGKMKGAVVVRMPPQFLDKFLFDVRGSLGKNSELKHQRIGSADITKQFTDIESRLRAARAMEERIIKIIQTGKGEVKDLIAAERELGVWRTKIEEMEGEIRYFNNQVGLSTLTINLTEREISTPFALVTSEKVQMRLEVEEAGKALEAALKAVDQFKGRVVKSESKQFKAGQVEATLLAEIPPQAKESFRAALRRLGIVSEDEATQKTQSEGGSGKPGKLEPKVLDVAFEVTLNNIVNIPPRNSVNLDIAANDVAAAYARIEAFVLKKGQMRVATKSEPDKQRVTAYLEFNVPNEHKDEADKLVAAVGPVLKQQNVQLPITEVATSQKFGFKLNLFSVATIAPREIVKLRLEVDNVKVRAAEIEALGKASKGQVERGRFLQSPQGTTTTVVAVRVPMAVADTFVHHCVTMSKEVIENEQTPNQNVPENDLATTVVIVTLTGGNPIVPKDQDLGAQISKGLYWAFWMFCMCMIFIVSGLAFVVPIVVVIWAAVRIGTWMWGGSKTTAIAVAPKAEPAPPKPEEQKPAGNA